MAGQRKGKIYYSMQAISVLPLFIFGLILIFSSSFFFSKAMHKEVCNGLEDAAELCTALLDSTYPGDYRLVETDVNQRTAFSLYKGETDITTAYSLVDNIKSITDMDATLFYQDTRILTTITDWNGIRIIGSGAPENVVTDVLTTGTPRFYDNVLINNTTYFAYYTPVYNTDGSVAGMLFVGKPTDTVNKMIRQSILPVILIGCIGLLVTVFISFIYAKQIVTTLHKLKAFFAKAASGNLNTAPDASIMKREDEFSEIGQAALTMQRSLKNLVERDALTDLYNRRSCDKMLRATIDKARSNNTSFCAVLADIDHFKFINDTYGHESGDIVLQNVANLLKNHIHKKGYVGRWGGEEFLIIYENCELAQAKNYLQTLQTTIHETSHKVADTEIRITLTFGLVSDTALEPHELIKKADEHLYTGKKNGRDCIVS